MSANSSTASLSDAPQPRLCCISKWPDFDGYGFHLQAIKSKPGQFIGKIDADSPAEAAGLRQGDRIVEVNGVNINNENHVQVVERIKANPKSVDLLVVDPQCYAYYEEQRIIVKSSMDHVLVLANKLRVATLEENRSDSSTAVTPSPNPSSASLSSSGQSRREEKQEEKVELLKEESRPKVAMQVRNQVEDLPAPAASPKEEKAKETQGAVLDFDRLSAAEMRARLAERKRLDPRQENLTAKQKHQIIQAL